MPSQARPRDLSRDQHMTCHMTNMWSVTTLVLKDNQSIIKAAKDPALHSWTKHTLLKYYYIREARQAGIFDILYIDTKRMPADGLTKPLSGIAHQKFLCLIGLNLI